MPILVPQIETFLATQSSFELEMKVANRLRAWKFQVDHVGGYDDGVTGKRREFDIRAKKQNGNLQVLLAVECTVVDPGLLVYCSKRKTTEAGHQVLIGSNSVPVDTALATQYTRKSSDSRIVTHPVNWTVYEPGQLVGRHRDYLKVQGNAVTRVGDKDFYDKVTQAIASIEAMLDDQFMLELDGKKLAVAAIPIIVVPDDSLYVAEYDDDGNRLGVMSTKSISQKVNFCLQSPKFKLPVISHVEIVAFSGLLDRLKDFLDVDRGQDNTPLFYGVGHHDGNWFHPEAGY